MGTDMKVYDDFITTKADTIRSIAWQGIRRTAAAPPRFNLEILSDSGVTGIGVLYQGTYSADQVNEHLDGTQACGNSPQQQCGWYSYSAALATPFTTTGTTRYWLMLQVESLFDSSPTGWQWRKGTPDNGFSKSTIANTIFPWDFAFAIR
jgi:hypothetical protein